MIGASKKADGPPDSRPFGNDSTTAEYSSTPLLVDEREAARLLGVSPRTVFDLGKRGDLPTLRIGCRKLFPLQGLKAYIALRTEGGSR
jgi:excisionase family DNA binding protein